jgi:hypothetical protein
VRLHKRARIVDFGWTLTYVTLLLPRLRFSGDCEANVAVHV